MEFLHRGRRELWQRYVRVTSFGAVLRSHWYLNPARSFEPYSVAQTQGLATINSAGNAVIKVDNTTVGNRAFINNRHEVGLQLIDFLFSATAADNAYGRSSVYMTSNAAINIGSLILFDAVHVPFGVRTLGRSKVRLN